MSLADNGKSPEEAHLATRQAWACSEGPFRAIFRDAGQGMALVDLDGRIVEANDAMARMLGYTVDELAGMPIAAVTDARDLPGEFERARALFARGAGCLRLEKRYIHRDGSTIWARVNISVLRGADGNVAGAIGLIEDISGQRHAEAERQEIQQRLQAIVERVSDVIWTARYTPAPSEVFPPDVDTLLRGMRFTYASPSFLRTMGYAADAAAGMTLLDIVTPESAKHAREFWSAALAGGAMGELTLTLECPTKDGELTWWESVATPTLLPDGGLELTGVARDITRRRAAEAALCESESRFRCLFENLPDFVALVDRDGINHVVNHSPTGAAPETFTGQRGIDHLVPADRPAAEAILARAFDTGQVQSIDVSDIYGLTWETRLVPLPEPVGQYVMVISTDITARRQAEKKVLREQRLLRKILRLHERERQAMAYDVHDGVAQKLTGALFRLQAVRAKCAGDRSAPLAVFDEGVRLLQECVADARRLISGLRPPILDEAGLVAAVQYLIGERRGPASPKISFRFATDAQRLPRSLEAVVFRIIQEGLSNACRHARARRIAIRLEKRSETIIVDIRDWGVGFDVKQARRGHYGLQGIRDRARLFGGQARFVSEPGKGTQIVVRLPLGAAE